jgi:hypothetical protein
VYRGFYGDFLSRRRFVCAPNFKLNSYSFFANGCEGVSRIRNTVLECNLRYIVQFICKRPNVKFLFVSGVLDSD